jgi:hypothetical protein
MLAGEWVGSYDFPDRGRAGSVLFRLEADEEVAHGDVLMLLDDANARYTAWGGADPWARAPGPTSVFLDIALVSNEQGLVSGALDPYEDPLCGCTLDTTFEGRLVGDRIQGTFVARTPGGEELAGEWEVERMPR